MVVTRVSTLVGPGRGVTCLRLTETPRVVETPRPPVTGPPYGRKGDTPDTGMNGGTTLGVVGSFLGGLSTDGDE